MSDGRHGWFGGWVTLIGAIAALITAWVSYMAYAHPRQNPADSSQSFSVPVNSVREVGTIGRRMKDASLNFEVKKCDVAPKLVSCVLTVVSPRYDRRFMISSNQSQLTDGDGDSFRMAWMPVNAMLDRDQKFTFKIEFAVNKNIVLPATVQMGGYIDNNFFEKSFPVGR